MKKPRLKTVGRRKLKMWGYVWTKIGGLEDEGIDPNKYYWFPRELIQRVQIAHLLHDLEI